MHALVNLVGLRCDGQIGYNELIQLYFYATRVSNIGGLPRDGDCPRSRLTYRFLHCLIQ